LTASLTLLVGANQRLASYHFIVYKKRQDFSLWLLLLSPQNRF
jgi:hypothetical protein